MNKDPRDKRFYQLKKKDISQLDQAEIEVMISYCDNMISYVGDKKSRRSWIELKTELEARLS